MATDTLDRPASRTRRAVAASFATHADAEAAVRDLRKAGVPDAKIGILSRDKDRSGLPNDPTGSRWEEGTGIGAAAGAATGVGLGLAVAAGLLPPLGPLIAGGALVALLASAGAGATVGTVIGGLIGLGIPEDEAEYYQSEVNEGRTLVTVHADDADEAYDILTRNNGRFRPAA